MNNLIKNSREKYGLPVNFWRIIKRYWPKSGKFFKDYRDVDQHHLALITHSFLELKPSVKILVLLTNNPEIKNPLDFTYNKEIDAIRFLKRIFIEFNGYIEALAKGFAYNATPIFPSWDLNHYGDLSGKKGTMAVMIDNSGRLLHFDISANQ